MRERIPLDRLIRAREHLGLSRPQFAQRIGVKRHYIFAIETGIRSPSLAVMTRWAEALGPGVSLDIFRVPQQPADAAE